MTAQKAPVRGFYLPNVLLYTCTNRIYKKLFKAKGENGQLNGNRWSELRNGNAELGAVSNERKFPKKLKQNEETEWQICFYPQKFSPSGHSSTPIWEIPYHLLLITALDGFLPSLSLQHCLYEYKNRRWNRVPQTDIVAFHSNKVVRTALAARYTIMWCD